LITGNPFGVMIFFLDSKSGNFSLFPLQAYH
jgi:hypothetical protein